MICEICSNNNEKCLEYNNSIEKSFNLCVKDDYKKTKLSPHLLINLLEDYDKRINVLENIIGRPNLRL